MKQATTFNNNHLAFGSSGPELQPVMIPHAWGPGQAYLLHQWNFAMHRLQDGQPFRLSSNDMGMLVSQPNYVRLGSTHAASIMHITYKHRFPVDPVHVVGWLMSYGGLFTLGQMRKRFAGLAWL